MLNPFVVNDEGHSLYTMELKEGELPQEAHAAAGHDQPSISQGALHWILTMMGWHASVSSMGSALTWRKWTEQAAMASCHGIFQAQLSQARNIRGLVSGPAARH